uniref:collagen-like triple helix repeat-containing protein n=1 Tax=Corallococcus coralloides TaxID=184914 RepID=UPI000FFF240F|nr:collagen-like protein [Corallococcus coralloides]
MGNAKKVKHRNNLILYAVIRWRRPVRKRRPRTSTTDIWIYRLLRACRINCSLREVIRRRYPKESYVYGDISSATEFGIKGALEVMQRIDQSETSRRSILDDKAKWLFALASALLTVLTGIMTRLPFWAGFLGVLAVIPLLLTGMLLLWYFGINNRSVPDISDKLLSYPTEIAIRRIILRNWSSTVAYNAANNSFHVDLYRAARRLVSVAYILVSLTAVLAFLASTKKNNILEEVRGNPELTELLRGPAGVQGPAGPKGPQGEMGPTGLPGVGSCEVDAGSF